MTSNLYQRIYEVVAQIPKGKVATYGQISKIVECNPRVVGYAMRNITEKMNLPWYRVINSRGKVSFPLDSDAYFEQRSLLEAEGVTFSEKNVISLDKFGWI